MDHSPEHNTKGVDEETQNMPAGKPNDVRCEVQSMSSKAMAMESQPPSSSLPMASIDSSSPVQQAGELRANGTPPSSFPVSSSQDSTYTASKDPTQGSSNVIASAHRSIINTSPSSSVVIPESPRTTDHQSSPLVESPSPVSSAHITKVDSAKGKVSAEQSMQAPEAATTVRPRTSAIVITDSPPHGNSIASPNYPPLVSSGWWNRHPVLPNGETDFEFIRAYKLETSDDDMPEDHASAPAVAGEPAWRHSLRRGEQRVMRLEERRNSQLPIDQRSNLYTTQPSSITPSGSSIGGAVAAREDTPEESLEKVTKSLSTTKIQRQAAQSTNPGATRHGRKRSAPSPTGPETSRLRLEPNQDTPVGEEPHAPAKDRKRSKGKLAKSERQDTVVSISKYVQQHGLLINGLSLAECDVISSTDWFLLLSDEKQDRICKNSAAPGKVMLPIPDLPLVTRIVSFQHPLAAANFRALAREYFFENVFYMESEEQALSFFVLLSGYFDQSQGSLPAMVKKIRVRPVLAVQPAPWYEKTLATIRALFKEALVQIEIPVSAKTTVNGNGSLVQKAKPPPMLYWTATPTQLFVEHDMEQGWLN